jgi:folylpolyglutamate synthase/dihydropteroate synthase
LADAYALAKSQTDRVIVITGSLFLVGEALGRLGFSADAANVSERELVLQ